MLHSHSSLFLFILFIVLNLTTSYTLVKVTSTRQGFFASDYKTLALTAKRRTKIAPLRDPVEPADPVIESQNLDPKLFQDDKDYTQQTRSTPQTVSKPSVNDELQDDIMNYKSKIVTNNDDRKENGVINAVKDVLSGILIADFFVVIFFLVWFIAASISKEAFANAYLLERFQDIFQPVIQPALGILMGGSVISGLIGDRKKDNE